VLAAESYTSQIDEDSETISVEQEENSLEPRGFNTSGKRCEHAFGRFGGHGGKLVLCAFDAQGFSPKQLIAQDMFLRSVAEDRSYRRAHLSHFSYLTGNDFLGVQHLLALWQEFSLHSIKFCDIAPRDTWNLCQNKKNLNSGGGALKDFLASPTIEQQPSKERSRATHEVAFEDKSVQPTFRFEKSTRESPLTFQNERSSFLLSTKVSDNMLRMNAPKVAKSILLDMLTREICPGNCPLAGSTKRAQDDIARQQEASSSMKGNSTDCLQQSAQKRRSRGSPHGRANMIEFIQENPKRANSMANVRYDLYKKAKTTADALRLGATLQDLEHDRRKGYLKAL
jgi:hypothetical protein